MTCTWLRRMRRQQRIRSSSDHRSVSEGRLAPYVHAPDHPDQRVCTGRSFAVMAADRVIWWSTAGSQNTGHPAGALRPPTEMAMTRCTSRGQSTARDPRPRRSWAPETQEPSARPAERGWAPAVPARRRCQPPRPALGPCPDCTGRMAVLMMLAAVRQSSSPLARSPWPGCVILRERYLGYGKSMRHRNRLRTGPRA